MRAISYCTLTIKCTLVSISFLLYFQYFANHGKKFNPKLKGLETYLNSSLNLDVFSLQTNVTLLELPCLEGMDGSKYNSLLQELKMSNVCASQVHENVNFETMSMDKIVYLDNYRNPCWYEKEKDQRIAVLKCLPLFYIAGVEKCGTTDLYDSLIVHDKIIPGHFKEPHYWSKYRFNPGKYFSTYLEHFTTASEKILLDTEDTKDGVFYHPSVAVDASADTFGQNFAWKKFLKQFRNITRMKEILTPFQIKRIAPQSLFIIILRNPVDRLYSSYNFFPMIARKGDNSVKSLVIDDYFASKSPEDFHNNTVLAIEWFENCTKFLGNECFFWNPDETVLDSFVTHLQMGFYGKTLQLWLKAFPLSSFKFVRLEDYSGDKIGVVNEILDFLKLDPLSDSLKALIKTRNIKNVGHRKGDKGPMLPQTRKLLNDFYKPFNEILAAIIGNNNFLYAI